jgi:adenylate cyclase
MVEERVQRRLAAILIADVVGYSRMMEADEEGTRTRLRKLHAEIIDPGIAADGGRIVKTSGDGTLVEFPSAVDAVRNAVRTQAAIREHNREIPEDRKIVYRVGINVGDIIVEGDDIFGDGVNVASRLEGLCIPGEVYISGNVYEHIKDKLSVDFEDLGEQTVKNISNPVRMYRVFDANTQDTSAKPPAMAPPPPPDKPSIAVLPFDNMSNDPEQEYFSDGLVEDLITDISKISGLFVIARNSSFAFKGQAIDVKEIAHKLGVKHVVEGSVRKMGSKLRINAQLIDAASGGHIWAERYDGDMENIFEFQDDIRDQIVAALKVSLTPAEQNEAERHLTDNVEAYELFLRARTVFFQFNPQAFDTCISLYKQAIEIDPGFAAAYANLAMPLQTGWSFAWPGYDDALEKALNFAEKAVEIDSDLGLAHARLAWVQGFMRQYESAVANFERAIELSPNDAEAHAYFAQLLNWVGDPERSIEMTLMSVRLDPLLPPNCAMHWGEALYHLNQFDEAVEKLQDCIERAPAFFVAHLILGALYGELGKVEEAASELAISRGLLPGDSLRISLERLPWQSEELRSRIYDGLRRAGMSDI